MDTILTGQTGHRQHLSHDQHEDWCQEHLPETGTCFSAIETTPGAEDDGRLWLESTGDVVTVHVDVAADLTPDEAERLATKLAGLSVQARRQAHQPWCALEDQHGRGHCYSPEVKPAGAMTRLWLTDTPAGPRVIIDGTPDDMTGEEAGDVAAALLQLADLLGQSR